MNHYFVNKLRLNSEIRNKKIFKFIFVTNKRLIGLPKNDFNCFNNSPILINKIAFLIKKLWC
jgi:hypothetical protein